MTGFYCLSRLCGLGFFGFGGCYLLSFHCDICDLGLGFVFLVEFFGVAVYSDQGHVLLVEVDLFWWGFLGLVGIADLVLLFDLAEDL